MHRDRESRVLMITAFPTASRSPRHGCCGILWCFQASLSKEHEASTPPTALQRCPIVPETCSYTSANKVLSLSALQSRKTKQKMPRPGLGTPFSSPDFSSDIPHRQSDIILRWLLQDGSKLFIE